MKDKIELEKERDTVDNFVITALITLIAAFIIIITLKTPSDVYVSYATIISLFCLIFSLFACLWHRFRFPFRQKIFLIERDKKISDISGDIADFVETFIMPLQRAKAKEIISINPNITKEELKKQLYTSEDKANSKKIIITHLDKFNYELKIAYEKAFIKP